MLKPLYKIPLAVNSHGISVFENDTIFLKRYGLGTIVSKTIITGKIIENRIKVQFSKKNTNAIFFFVDIFIENIIICPFCKEDNFCEKCDNKGYIYKVECEKYLTTC